MDLAVYLLEGPTVELPAALEPVSPEPLSMPTSIRSAWASFIAPSSQPAQPPPPKAARREHFCERAAVVPAGFFVDSAIRVRFRHPATAVPPPRLATFAMPARVDSDLVDRPRDVCFCLTHADGARIHGSALQICDADPADPEGRVVVRCLVLLSRWPVYELWKTMLHTIFSRREELWPAGAPLSPSGRARFPTAPADAASPRLAALLEQTGRVLEQSRQELCWLTSHPLWLSTPLAPLFKSLRWQPSEAAYLLAAVLTDQKVLIHSADAQRLYCATCALRALITPLVSSSIFIPLLPQVQLSRAPTRFVLSPELP